MIIRELKARRDEILDRMTQDRFEGGYPRLYELWPCVRRSALERLMRRKGHPLLTSKRAALAFLRGNIREPPLKHAIEQGSPVPAFVVLPEGVTLHPDAQTGDAVRPFAEIKSTTMSSRNIWELFVRGADEGTVDLQQPDASYVRGYFEQCAGYAAALGARRFELHVSWERGDYAEQRRNCPECKTKLSDFKDGLYKDCPKCGYRSYRQDYRVYELEFTDEELAWWRNELFTVRAQRHQQADKATTKGQVLAAAPGTPNSRCADCEPGRWGGCEFYGREQ